MPLFALDPKQTNLFACPPRHSQHFSNLIPATDFTRDRAGAPWTNPSLPSPCPRKDLRSRQLHPINNVKQQIHRLAPLDRTLCLYSSRNSSHHEVVEPIGIEPTTSSLQS